MAVTGSLSGVGQSASFAPETVNSVDCSAPFNVSLWGTFAATVQLERTFDNGANWLPITVSGTVRTFTAPLSETFSEPENNVQYRLRCTAWTSGTVNYRLSN